MTRAPTLSIINRVAADADDAEATEEGPGIDDVPAPAAAGIEAMADDTRALQGATDDVATLEEGNVAAGGPGNEAADRDEVEVPAATEVGTVIGTDNGFVKATEAATAAEDGVDDEGA